jgi:hypothetical protein
MATQSECFNLFPGDRGRMKLSQPTSQEQVSRPIRRPLALAASYDDVSMPPSGKRSMAQPQSGELNRAEQRHNLPAYTRSGYDESEPKQWKSRASVAWPGKAANAAHYISTERILEAECGIKVKVRDRATLRNGIPQRAPGDKMYTHVDYSPGFFYQEGVRFYIDVVP